MVWNAFPQALALDEATGDIARNIVGQVYDLADLARANPLPMQDPTGVPLVGATSNRLGLIQRFRVEDRKVVVWKSGAHEVEIISIEAVVRDVELARTAAEGAATSAGQAADAAAAVSGAQDAAVAGYIIDPASETHEAVIAVAGSAGAGTGTTITNYSTIKSLAGYPTSFPAAAADVTTSVDRQFVTQTERTALGSAATSKSVSDLAARVTAREADPRIFWKDTEQSPTPAGVREGVDVVLVRSVTTGGGGGGGGTVVDLTVLRRLLGEGVADGTALQTAVGTNDTAPDNVGSSSILWQVAADGEREIEIVNAAAAHTFRWSTAGSTIPGNLPALSLWSFDFYLRIAAYPTSTTTILALSGSCGLSMDITGGLTVLNAALSGAAPSTVGGTAGSKSPALALSSGTTRYRVKGWRASTATGTLAKFRLYDPAGALIWDVSRDVGVASVTQFIAGRTGTTGGNYFFNRVRLDDAGAELVGV